MYKPFNQQPRQPRLRLNNLIRVPEVQVIDSDGAHLGVMPTHEALKRSTDQELDLVEVGPTAVPPIVKIMDYGKYVYQKERKEKQSKSKQTSQEVKTVKIGFRTEAHDLHVRAMQVNKFLDKGHRVKIELNLRGREKGMVAIARTKLTHFMTLIAPEHVVETPLKAFPGGLQIMVKNK